jgi:hypothetical protein
MSNYINYREFIRYYNISINFIVHTNKMNIIDIVLLIFNINDFKI